MSTFVETANFDYRLLFADQGKQTHAISNRNENGSPGVFS
jgi:hypothetical protein